MPPSRSASWARTTPARLPSTGSITRKGSSAVSWVCVSRTCGSLPTCIFCSTRAWPTASESASFCVKFRKGNQTPAAELAPPRPEVAELAPRIWQVIDDAPVLTAVTHKDADGDTLGSALAPALALVSTEAASTGELVYDLLKAWKLQIPAGAASCLYATILSDTGGFRHDNTSAHALRAAAELVQLGADPVMIARGLFKSRPASSLRMQGRILQGLHFEFGDRLVWGSISQAGLRDSGATTDQADSAIDQLNTVRGQELAILFKEAGPRLTKVSIRSRDLVDAAELAAKFGGGGHRRA